MVHVGVREQNKVDVLRIKAERFGVFLAEFTPSFIHSAIDQYPPPGALHQMAGTGDATVRTVERQFRLRGVCR